MISGVGRVAVLCLTAILLLASSSAISRGPSSRSMTEMRALVEDFAHAVEVNHLELAMTYVHPESPHRPRLETEVGDQLSWCLQRAETLSFELAEPRGDSVSVHVVQRLVRVFGLKIAYSVQDSIFVFRKQREQWRLWNVQPREA
jgi:hypothetical protein